MKPLLLSPQAALGFLILFSVVFQAHADITVRLSVKFILSPGGVYPAGGNIGTNTDFQAEVDRGNTILATTGRGYRLQVVEYVPIQPPPPAGSNANYWFTLDARNNRSVFESAALAATGTWRWNGSALNIFVNDSSSGSCSFVGSGLSISLGKSVTTGTVLHEIGHFFNLKHTHLADTICTNPPPYVIGDGDGLAVTIPDHNCLTLDGLSTANYGSNYAVLTAGQQAAVNTSWMNVMSYHQEDQLFDDQMDIWGQSANGARLFTCSGKSWFVAVNGSDANTGGDAGVPFATLPKALSSVGNSDEVVLIKAGNYKAPVAGLINTPCSLRATRGAVFIAGP